MAGEFWLGFVDEWGMGGWGGGGEGDGEGEGVRGCRTGDTYNLI
jgi:hypothetical protein